MFDKLGRQPVIAFGLVMFAIGSFVAAVGHSMAWIIVARVIQGMGEVSSAVIAFFGWSSTKSSVGCYDENLERN